MAPSARARELATLAWCALPLLAAEGWARLRTTPYLEHVARVRASEPGAVLILGDSSAQQGLSPRVLEAEGVSSPRSFALPSGSGLFARSLADEVTWRPELVVYAGVPIEAFDVPPLQREEREHVPLVDLARARSLDADALFARVSVFYRQRPFLFPAIADRLFPESGGRAPRAVLEADNFLRVSPDSTVTTEEQQAAADRKAQIWFSHGAPSTRLRFSALLEALQRWAPPPKRRALLVLPISAPLRAHLYQHLPRDEVRSRWAELAAEADAALLDCLEALPDDAFWDDDHLIGASGEAFSQRIAPWLRALSEAQPAPSVAGCTGVR